MLLRQQYLPEDTIQRKGGLELGIQKLELRVQTLHVQQWEGRVGGTIMSILPLLEAFAAASTALRANRRAVPVTPSCTQPEFKQWPWWQ